jgi:hypothetical protein
MYIGHLHVALRPDDVKRNHSHFSHYFDQFTQCALKTNHFFRTIPVFAGNHFDCRGSWVNGLRFLYIATQEAYFHGVAERFQSIVRRPLEPDVSGEILRYFRIRRKWDNHEYIIPVTEDLEFLKDARERFRTENIERLYKSWRAGELAESELRAQISQRKAEPAIFFGTYLVRGDRSVRPEMLATVTGA